MKTIIAFVLSSVLFFGYAYNSAQSLQNNVLDAYKSGHLVKSETGFGTLYHVDRIPNERESINGVNNFGVSQTVRKLKRKGLIDENF